ncbi:MAG: hypothetical protein RL701_6423 [Pseudomonadota bacterium]
MINDLTDPSSSVLPACDTRVRGYVPGDLGAGPRPASSLHSAAVRADKKDVIR